MSHSKRNTTRPVFTAYERTLARAAWSASSARLTRESFLPFASCALCLDPARDPVACAAGGDLFCRECALADILAQRKEVRRAEKAREAAEREGEEERARREEEARVRAVREFELVQAGLEGKAGTGGGAAGGGGVVGVGAGWVKKKPEERRDSTSAADTVGRAEMNGSSPSSSERRGEKRKFELDEDELQRIAAEDRAKARRAIDDEKAAKPTVPFFWAPTVTPSSNTNDVLHEVKKKIKTQPVCPASAGDKLHHYSLHTLVTVNFAEEADPNSKTTPQRVCPACKKALSNASKAVLAKPCGHVLCKSCVAKFMAPPGGIDPHSPGKDPASVRCYVCDADLTERKGGGGKEKEGKADKEKEKIKPGLVELRSEGTGFSAGGNNQVQKSGVNFQC